MDNRQQLQDLVEKELQKYPADTARELSAEAFTERLKQELPEHFAKWADPKMTGVVGLGPIERVDIEFDESGYAYACLYPTEGTGVSEGTAVNLWNWGLNKLFAKHPERITKFIALCYAQALPEACRSTEFQALPRAEHITFNVGQHAGWQFDNVYRYSGEAHIIEYGNLQRLKLKHRSSCATDANTVERTFMDHLQQIDVDICAAEFQPHFEQMLQWLIEQKPEPLECIIIAWSSDFNKPMAMGGFNDDTTYRWPETFNIYKWFSDERPNDFDEESLSSVRRCISNKLAEIACIVTENIVDTELFQKIPKLDNFEMVTSNRTAGSDPVFYPFDHWD